jgi:succinoglycan biosynthesis protein ExoA
VRTRILHLRASNFVGGPEKQILHHALDMRNSDFEILIGSFRDRAGKAEILERAEQSGVATFESRSSGRFDPRAIFELASFIRLERIDLLCTHGFKANTIGTLAKKLAHVPQIAFCRGWTNETIRVRVYEFLERRFLMLADRIICVSEAQAEYFATRHFLQPQILVVHNAMLDSIDAQVVYDRAASKVQLGFAPTTRLIGAVGRLSIEKGQRYLVEAVPELAREFKDLKIVLLGEGRERTNLKRQVKRLGLDNLVMLPGFQKNVARWMQAFDVLVNCSLTEGMPNAILEALAFGTPVVATSVGGVPELIKDRETGLLVTPGSPEALARGVAEVLRDSSLASHLGHAGRNWAQKRFSASGQRDLLLRIYREILKLPAASASPATTGSTPDLADTINSSSEISRKEGTKCWPLLSIVIPVRNEESHLGQVLKGLLAQDYPRERYEILIVDGESTDGTSRIVKEVATGAVRVRLLRNPQRLASAGRNVGVRQSTGEFVIFIDGHCKIPSKTFLRDTATTFEKSGAECLCRPQPLNIEGNGLFQNAVALARSTTLGHARDSMIYDTAYEGVVNPCSAGAMYRRTVFKRVGYFDESFDAAEDVEFNYRILKAGLSAYMSPQLAIHYQPRASFEALWGQMQRYGRGRFRLIQKHPKTFSLTQILPGALLLWLVVGSIVATMSRPALELFGISLGIYGFVILYFSLGLGWRHDLRYLLLCPPIFLTIHLGLGTGFLAEALRIGRSRVSYPDVG